MKKLISIVTSAYNEESNINELTSQLRDVFEENSGYDFEIIFVDNGSTDKTFENILSTHKQDKRFKIVRLSRNFRMDGGINAGMYHAKGDAIVIMTANLQDRPAVITQFIKKWEEGYENVYGIVKKRPNKGLFRQLNSQLFYYVINLMTGNLIPKNVSDFRLIDKKVCEVIKTMYERNRFTRGMFAWVGFRSVGVEYERAPRHAGKSHAKFFQVLQLALQGIFAFSYLPIKLISMFGFIVSAASALHFVITIIRIFVSGVPFAGYGTIVSLIVLLFGILFFMLGILGQYIAQIYEEVKARPNFIVAEKIGLDHEKK